MQYNKYMKWKYPPAKLLHDSTAAIPKNIIPDNIKALQHVLDSFKIKANVVKAYRMPQYIKYYVEPGSGVHTDEIRRLTHEFARAVSSLTGSVFVTPCEPGTPYIGVDIPLKDFVSIPFKYVITSKEMRTNTSKLAVSLGLSATNTVEVASLEDLTHVMIGGTTGSGKSMLLHSWICSLLMRTTPEEVRFMLIDPKRVEFIGYNGLPHLLSPIITDSDKAIDALTWVHDEMEKRYRVFTEVGVRNIGSYNELSDFQALPYIVMMIDEFSDLMAYDGRAVEKVVNSLAQMARATGIHSVISTSRLAQDVYTDMIRANILTHIAFNTISRKDSQKIIDISGAEYLLGNGDMFIQFPGEAHVKRIQGAMISEKEIYDIVSFIKENNSSTKSDYPDVLE